MATKKKKVVKLVKKEVPLFLVGSNYKNEDDWLGDSILCASTLKTFFKFPCGKAKLIGVLSNKKITNSYPLEMYQGEMYVGGKAIASYWTFENIVKAFIRKHGVCYGRIEY